MKSLKGKTALITGASSGIGEAFAWEMAKNGCNLILTARSIDKLDSLSSEINAKYSVKTTTLKFDLTEKDSVGNMAAEIFRQNLEVDILVNNAGFGKWTGFLSEELSNYEKMMQLNMNALVALTYIFLPNMLARKSGGIINIASTGSFQPCPYIAVYCATKAFVLSFSEALFGEYNDQGVTVTAVCPGNTDTDFFKVANADTSGMSSASPEMVAKEGLRAFLANKNYTITGRFTNYMQAMSSRFLPRKTIIGIVANMFRGRVERLV